VTLWKESYVADQLLNPISFKFNYVFNLSIHVPIKMYVMSNIFEFQYVLSSKTYRSSKVLDSISLNLITH
jgi:hypothetical protein